MKNLDALFPLIKDGPLVKFNEELSYGRQILIKSEERNHPILQGNKWHKLKLNLKAYYDGDFANVISFGGAFSNHIYATAGACHLLSIPCKIYIRGYHFDSQNPTLLQLQQWDTDIELLSPSKYKKKDDLLFLNSLHAQYPSSYIIPEGGSNELGFKGSLSFAERLKESFAENMPDFLCVAAGTGATAAAVQSVFDRTKTQVLVFSSLKGVDFAKIFLEKYGVPSDSCRIFDDYFGGYGKVSRELILYINRVYQASKIRLEPIYTGKMFFAIDQLLQKGFFPDQSKICIIHSGGLQGIAGYNYRYGKKYGYLVE